MSARTSFPCAPFNGDAVALSKESSGQSKDILENRADCEQLDRDLPSLDAALPSPPLMSTTELQPESPTTEANKEECHDVKSESGSDVVMSPSWGVLLISPRRCGPTVDEADTQQLWNDATYGTPGHTYLVDSSPDNTAEASFSWESFFAAMRDNTLPHVAVVGVPQ